MADAPLINIVATRCKKEDEAKFNQWYNETHVPMLMKFKGMKAVARYKIASESPDYPPYLAIYEFESRRAFQDFEKSPELAAAREETKISWPAGLDIRWRVQYEFMKSWGSGGREGGKPVINFIATRCKKEDEPRFNQWYDGRHIPMLLQTERIKEVVRYRITRESSEYPPYLTIYYFKNRKAYDEYFASPARHAAVKAMEEEWPDNQFEITWRMQYGLLKNWSQ